MSATRDAANQVETDALLASGDADNDLALLACLENGQVSDVKRVLIYRLGLLYHRWVTKPHGEVPLAITMSNKVQRVWLILAECRVLCENQIGLAGGSEVLVQCFVPQTIIEIALKEVDEALKTKGMLRTDVIKCVRFEGSMHEYDVPDFVKRDVEQARAVKKTVVGTFFTSQDTASFQSEDDRIE